MSVILVTGSSTGIGQETALHMARKGHEVYAAVRNPDTAAELKETGMVEIFRGNIGIEETANP